MGGKRTRGMGDVIACLRGLLACFVPGKGFAAPAAPGGVNGFEASGDVTAAGESGASDVVSDAASGVVSGMPHDAYGDVPSQVTKDTAAQADSKAGASTFVEGDGGSVDSGASVGSGASVDSSNRDASTFVEGKSSGSSIDSSNQDASTFVEGDSKTLDSTGIEGSTFVERPSADSDSDVSAASTFVDGDSGSGSPVDSSSRDASTFVDDASHDPGQSDQSDPSDQSGPSEHSTPSAPANPSAPSTPINPIAAPTEPDPDHSVNPNGPTLPSLYTPLPLTATIAPDPAATEPLTLTTWEHITGTDQEGLAERKAERRETRRSNFFGILSILLITVSALVIGTPFAMRAMEQRQANTVSSQSAKTVAGWPYPKAKEALAAARAYNQRLAKTSQSVIGEAHDPFASESGGSKTSKEDDSLAAKDKEYQSLLDTGEGVMGTVRIPKISVNLPIYHGTSEDALARGVGHLYGTSLPAGGKNSHTVLTGHRGLVNAELFTRLDELRKGDYIYIDVMGETLGYKVDRISVIEPSDVSKLKVEPGKDRITLMTCTPYGVNTHRLLVSGLRGKIPHPIPDPDAAPKDVRAIAVRVGLVAGGCVLVAWLWLGCLAPNRDRWMLIQHAGTRPDWM